MDLKSIIARLDIIEIRNSENIEINGVSVDSRKVRPSDIFVCINGENFDGHDFAINAYKNGAVAIVCQRFIENLNCVPQIIVKSTIDSLVSISSMFYEYPTCKMNVIGVTGTNGKTTVSHLIQNIIEKSEMGSKCGLIGTLGYKMSLNDYYHPTGNTTPFANDLQAIFKQMENKGIRYCSVEVSSHAIDQNRIGGTFFKCAVFTNLTQDHLDYHITMNNYFNTKAKLFEQLESSNYAIINNDDEYCEKLISKISDEVKVITYGIESASDIMAKDIKFTGCGTSFTCVITPYNPGYSGICEKHESCNRPCRRNHYEVEFNLKLVGLFNVYNALAAIATGLAFGIKANDIKNALESTNGVSGRFEIVNINPLVIVDYAHTPDGLENVLNAALKLKQGKDSNLICLFGCGGDRDATKRPKMGKIADNIADKVIITSDNPRGEDPNVIISDILSGIKTIDQNRIYVEVDRENAIEHACKMASKDDIVVVAGKGHETYQILKDQTIHFDDKEKVLNFFSIRT